MSNTVNTGSAGAATARATLCMDAGQTGIRAFVRQGTDTSRQVDLPGVVNDGTLVAQLARQSAAALTEERFADAMAALATLRAPLDAFFDKVVVNADNPAIRLNRLALLNRVRAAMAAVADLTKIEA